MFTLLLHKDPVYSLLMIPFKSRPVEYKESHIRLSTKRLRPQKKGDCFIITPRGPPLNWQRFYDYERRI